MVQLKKSESVKRLIGKKVKRQSQSVIWPNRQGNWSSGELILVNLIHRLTV